MKIYIKIFIIILLATLIIDNAKASWNSVYQFGIEINKSENGTKIYGKTNAFLWIPPKVKAIRAVLLAPSNVIERRLCDSPILRAQAEKDGLVIIFFNAGWQKETPLIEYIQMILDKLAEKSGYNELRTVPWITIGHSGNSTFCENMGRLKPVRMLANIVFKGKVPGVAKDGSTTGLAGIPILFIGGEFEEVMSSNKVRNFFWTEKLTSFAIDRKAVPQSLLSGMVDRGHGHFSLFPEMISYTTLFIHKAIDARLNKNGSLKDVHFESGWLTDPTGKNAPAPAKKYIGKPEEAFWHFDEEQVKAWIPLFFRDKGKKEQLVALTQNDTIAPWWKGWAVQQLDFKPLPDDISFRVGGTFRNEIPSIFADKGVKVGHSAKGPIEFDVEGWAGATEQTGPNTFRVRFDREGNNGRTTHIVIGAFHHGDTEYRETAAIAHFYVPGTNTEGTKQNLTFPVISNIKAGTKLIPLKAGVDSGLKPDYYVSWGPAEIIGDNLRITSIPANAKFPIEVKVTAYQWGKSTPPQYASSNTVIRTFLIMKD